MVFYYSSYVIDVLTRSNATPPCHVAKIEKEVKGESSLLSLGSGPSLRGHGVLGAVALGLALKLSRRCFPESPPKLGEELR
ncbi:hypothetical protein NEIRO03_0317 [Nematocida sp. AWRm78]|nr:hypothetical protein NEIRO02_0326 [Nematocida sp. AWRm79]KAI5182666.1 hypothetical protein NEIRO03_0317 [Nematocida sp. AWRm78]